MRKLISVLGLLMLIVLAGPGVTASAARTSQAPPQTNPPLSVHIRDAGVLRFAQPSDTRNVFAADTSLGGVLAFASGYCQARGDQLRVVPFGTPITDFVANRKLDTACPPYPHDASWDLVQIPDGSVWWIGTGDVNFR